MRWELGYCATPDATLEHCVPGSSPPTTIAVAALSYVYGYLCPITVSANMAIQTDRDSLQSKPFLTKVRWSRHPTLVFSLRLTSASGVWRISSALNDLDSRSRPHLMGVPVRAVTERVQSSCSLFFPIMVSFGRLTCRLSHSCFPYLVISPSRSHSTNP
ncbi:hypothetical protein BGW80DRAFT_639722 [Lactifluus volemus]|jgi:hypothetical protein|nr:hypothetical protein BGW80DRAFT_639722 [Lactifluus volemus]